MGERTKTSFAIDKDLMKALSHECVELEIEKSEAVERALREWLSKPASKAIPANAIESQVGIANESQTSKIIPSSNQFALRISRILTAVSPQDLPAVEEYLLRVAIRVTSPWTEKGSDPRYETGVYEPPPPEPLEDQPGMVGNVPTKRIKAG